MFSRDFAAKKKKKKKKKKNCMINGLVQEFFADKKGTMSSVNKSSIAIMSRNL